MRTWTWAVSPDLIGFGVGDDVHAVAIVAAEPPVVVAGEIDRGDRARLIAVARRSVVATAITSPETPGSSWHSARPCSSVVPAQCCR